VDPERILSGGSHGEGEFTPEKTFKLFIEGFVDECTGCKVATIKIQSNVLKYMRDIEYGDTCHSRGRSKRRRMMQAME
jgi:hypothetical protein